MKFIRLLFAILVFAKCANCMEIEIQNPLPQSYVEKITGQVRENPTENIPTDKDFIKRSFIEDANQKLTTVANLKTPDFQRLSDLIETHKDEYKYFAKGKEIPYKALILTVALEATILKSDQIALETYLEYPVTQEPALANLSKQLFFFIDRAIQDFKSNEDIVRILPFDRLFTNKYFDQQRLLQTFGPKFVPNKTETIKIFDGATGFQEALRGQYGVDNVLNGLYVSLGKTLLLTFGELTIAKDVLSRSFLPYKQLGFIQDKEPLFAINGNEGDNRYNYLSFCFLNGISEFFVVDSGANLDKGTERLFRKLFYEVLPFSQRIKLDDLVFGALKSVALSLQAQGLLRIDK